MKDKVIILGDDSVNTLGLVQCLGIEGLYPITILKGDNPKKGLISKSKFVGEIYPILDMEDGIQVLLEHYIEDEPLLVFPSGDQAALVLDSHKEELKEHFMFEYSIGEYSIAQLMQKQLQIELAKKCSFNVPFSKELEKGMKAPETFPFPCFIKPLRSYDGDKRDMKVVYSKEELNDILANGLHYSSSVQIQQYISRDYEYCMLGCACSNGSVIMPLASRMTKFNKTLANTMSVNYIEPLNDEIAIEVEKIKSLIQMIGYVGLFSVEFMHNSEDNKVYFTEINLRNDGENSFIVHGGVNLPYLHYLDMHNMPLKEYHPTPKSIKMIWEAVHFSALLNHEIGLREWLGDFKGNKHFLYYYKEDKKPFYYQFVGKVMRKLHR